jgi:lysophospholipase L1-like esterase
VDIIEAMKIKGVVSNAYFEPDCLHLNTKGYEVWKKELDLQFLNQYK